MCIPSTFFGSVSKEDVIYISGKVWIDSSLMEAMNLSGKDNSTNSKEDWSACYQFDRVWLVDPHQVVVPVLNCVLNIPTSVAAAFGNLLVLVSIWRTSSLHLPSFVLLFNLALSDLCVGLIVQPAFVTGTLARMSGAHDVLCLALISGTVSGSILCTVSLLTMTAISVDRYLAVSLHLRYQEVVTVARVIRLVVLVWLISAVSAISWLWPLNVFYIIAAVFISVSDVLVLFTYVKIYRVVRHHEAQIHAQVQFQEQQVDEHSRNVASCKKSAITMFVVHCVFVLCYLPYVCTLLMLSIGDHYLSEQLALEVSLTFVFINSCINPVVYCWRVSEIRKAMRESVRKLFCRSE